MDLQTIQNLMDLAEGPSFVLENDRLLLSNPEAEALGLCAGFSAEEILRELALPATGEQIQARKIFLEGRRWLLRAVPLDKWILCQLRPEAPFIPPANDNTLLHTAGSIRLAAQDLTTALDGLAESADIRSPEASQSASLALRSVYRLRRTAGDLELFVRLRSGSYQLKPELCDLGSKMAELCGELAELLETAGIALRRELPAAPERVCLDWRLVSAMLRELITNAAVQTSDRCITLSVQWIGSDKLCFRVKNRIAGVVPETLYHRHAAEQTDLRPGLGIGLSVVSAGAACHGGSLLLSAEDSGTVTAVFSIALSESLAGTYQSPALFPLDPEENLIALSPALPPEVYRLEDLL